VGEIDPGEDRYGQRQRAVKHQTPPGGRVLAATVDEDNQQKLNGSQHSKDRSWSPAG
jgi:hypothetical protein